MPTNGIKSILRSLPPGTGRLLAGMLFLLFPSLGLGQTTRPDGNIVMDASRSERPEVMVATTGKSEPGATFAMPSSAFGQLERLTELAPSRQVGQPGNDLVDKYIAERFAAAAKRKNEAQNAKAAGNEIKASRAADVDLGKASGEMTEAQTQSETSPSTRWWESTVEHPELMLIGLLLLTTMFLVSGRVQKRPVLLVMGAFLALLALALGIVSRFHTSVAPQGPAGQTTRSSADRDETLLKAAKASLKAELELSDAMKGTWQSGRMRYPATTFIPGRAELSVGTEHPVRLYQMAPNLIEPANLPGGLFSGPLVFAGKATPSELRGVNFQDAAVVVDFDCSKRWLNTVQLGASVIIVLEPQTEKETPGELFTEAAQKMTESPLSIPRFYLPRREAVSVLGEDFRKKLSSRPTATIHAEPGRWETKTAYADWLYIPGSAPPQPVGTPYEQDISRQLVLVQAYKDSASIVPELSPGANSAGNIVLLLRLMERFEKQAPARPVLLCAVNDHCNALHGEFEFAWYACAPAIALREEQVALEAELAQQRFIADLYSKGPSPELISSLRDGSARIGGQMLKFKDPISDRLSEQRNTVRLERNRVSVLLDDKDRVASLSPAALVEMRTHFEKIKIESDQLLELIQLFNRFGTRTNFADISGQQRARVVELFSEISENARLNAANLEERLKTTEDNLSLRRRLIALSMAGQTPPTRLTEILAMRNTPVVPVTSVSLDLSYGSDLAGFFFSGMLKSSGDSSYESDASQRVSRLAQLAVRQADLFARSADEPNRLVDTLLNASSPWRAWLGGKFAMGSQVLHYVKIPALSLAAIRDSRPHEFSPDDKVENINRRHFEDLTHFAEGYLPWLINCPELADIQQDRGVIDPMTTELSVKKADQFSVTVPKTPMPNALVLVLIPGLELPNNAAMLGQVRPWPIFLTDRRGVASIRGTVFRGGSLSVFGYDRDFMKMNAALDLGQGESRYPSNIDSTAATRFLPKTVVTDSFEKTDLIGLTEPLTLTPAQKLGVLDGRQDSVPAHYSMTGILSRDSGKIFPLANDGTGAVMMEPGTTFKLKISSGLAINATDQSPQGAGYESSSGLLRGLVLGSAGDMWRLTQQRLTDLASKGVKSDAASGFQDQSKALIDSTRQAQSQGHNDVAMIDAEEARGLSYQAYIRALGSINDLIKAVVIFLALLIPFCFFTMKLLSPFTDVNRQLALFAGIFMLMSGLLYCVHPAFAIAKTPSVVVLAFVMLGLAGFVASVLMGRFNSTMTQAVEESQLSEAVEAPGGRLAGVAFMVGINNMKRRRIRTALTCATIVLVTFTMLSVISVGQDASPAVVRGRPDSPYDGFLYANPGLVALNPVQVRSIRTHFEGAGKTIARAWAERHGSYGEYLGYDLTPSKPIENATVDTLSAKVLLGLEKAEDGLIGPMPLMPGGSWFSSDDAEEIVLSVKGARLLGISGQNMHGQKIMLNGRALKLVGLLDDEKIEAMMDMSDVPILPIITQADPNNQSQSESMKQALAAGATQLDAGGAIVGGAGTSEARALDVAFIPIDMARTLGEADYRTLSVKFDHPVDGKSPSELTWDAANRLIQFQHTRIAAGISKAVSKTGSDRKIDPGQYSMASSSNTEVGGILKIAVPIILAATIILNTMLGSVMERRREVSIYNAIGLNPGHVMVFFLAESLVFGMVGSVAGYLIGQVLSIIVMKLQLPLNLNYSSLSVMVVIFLAIATVLLSTLYPAMMAARAAVPSGQRRWSIPHPVGDEMFVQFPFSYDHARAMGVCAYLRDFMQQNSEASTGEFLAKVGPAGWVPPKGGVTGNPPVGQPKAFAMVFDIAPAPFDLGVNQKMEVYAYFDPKVRAHMLAVHLTRLSGQHGNWVAVNQPFLEALRKRLLGWRSQKKSTHDIYQKEGERLFHGAQQLPIVNGANGPGSSSAAGGGTPGQVTPQEQA